MDISSRPPSSSRSLQLPPTAEEEEEDLNKEEAPAEENGLSTSPTSSSTEKPSSSRLLIPPSDASAVSGVSNIQPQSARNLQNLISNMGAGVTYAGQDSLPRLPIPDLNETMEKFQYRLEALQDEAQREETKRVVHEFLEGDGPKLQEALREYEAEGIADERIGSYVEEFWNESYLKPDTSVVLNLNPYFVLEEGPDPKIAKSQLKRAASLCFASVKMASSLRNQTLAPDIFKGKPLCMDQFKALFGSSRQPTLNESDDVHVYNDSTHVVVICRNQLYYFSALWPDTGVVAVDEADILDILKAIDHHARNTDEIAERSRTALGVFTSLPRSKWAVIRKELCEKEMNRFNLQVIDSALFVLVLDQYVPKDINYAAANMLHGTNIMKDKDVTQVGSCLNRWYDKLQLVVCGDGTSGLVFEHSIIDGHTALRFTSDIFAETVINFAESIVELVHGRGLITHVIQAEIERAATALQDGPSLDVSPKKLVFELSQPILDNIFFAETALCDDISANDTHVLEFRDYGKRLITANKMSPDAFVQMSILLAYYKLYGKVVGMYEPALTKQFYHGRTEAIRGATMQAKQLCEIWWASDSSKEQKLDALRTATIEHSRLTKEASFGLGVDRHLFALKCMAEQQCEEGILERKPRFFKSEAWRMLNHTVLSTSNCGNSALRLFGFGPVVNDGFGIGYIIKADALSYTVSSHHRQNRRYVRSLQKCLKEMEELMQPISSVEVERQGGRATIMDAKRELKRTFSDGVNQGGYGDVWGESTPFDGMPSSARNMKILMRQESSSSRNFSKVTERTNSLDFLSTLNAFSIDIKMDELSVTSGSLDESKPQKDEKSK